MTNTEQKHTAGPVRYRQIERKGLCGFTIDTADAETEICEIYPKPKPVAVNESNARLLAASYNAFDSAAARLGLNAVELADQMQDGGIADLVEALKLAKQQMIQTGVVFGLGVMQQIDVALVKVGAV